MIAPSPSLRIPITHSYKNLTPSRWWSRKCLLKTGSTTTSTICFPLGTIVGRFITSAFGVVGSWRGVIVDRLRCGRTVFDNSGVLNCCFRFKDGVYSGTVLLALPDDSVLFTLDLLTKVGLLVYGGLCPGSICLVVCSVDVTAALPMNMRPDRYSFLSMTPSISSSLPPIDNAEPGSNGRLQTPLPISLPESLSVRVPYPFTTASTPSPSQVLFFLVVYFRHSTV